MIRGARRNKLLEMSRSRGEQLPNFCEQCFDTHRLRKCGIHRQLLLSIDVGGQYNDFNVLGLSSNRSCKPPSIYFSRHPDVGQDQVHVALSSEDRQGFIATIGLDDLKASATKLVGQIEPKEHLVFNYENSIFFCGFGLGL